MAYDALSRISGVTHVQIGPNQAETIVVTFAGRQEAALTLAPGTDVQTVIDAVAALDTAGKLSTEANVNAKRNEVKAWWDAKVAAGIRLGPAGLGVNIPLTKDDMVELAQQRDRVRETAGDPTTTEIPTDIKEFYGVNQVVTLNQFVSHANNALERAGNLRNRKAIWDQRLKSGDANFPVPAP